MSLYVNVGGAWRTVKAPAVNVGGAWHSISNAFVNVGGAWRQFFQLIPPFTPVTHFYRTPGTYTEMIPTGAKQVVIEAGGSGGGADQGYGAPGSPSHGTGGGSGSLTRITVPIGPGDWGNPFTVVVGTGGAANLAGTRSTVTGAASNRSISLTAGAGGGATVGVVGAAGVASGGDVNINGFPGDQSTAGGGDGAGGPAVGGALINSGAGGNSPGLSTAPGGPGQNGASAFSYT